MCGVGSVSEHLAEKERAKQMELIKSGLMPLSSESVHINGEPVMEHTANGIFYNFTLLPLICDVQLIDAHTRQNIEVNI